LWIHYPFWFNETNLLKKSFALPIAKVFDILWNCLSLQKNNRYE